MALAKRIMGFLMLGGMGYLAYIKIGQNIGHSEYAGFFIFFIIVLFIGLFLAIRKILTY